MRVVLFLLLFCNLANAATWQQRAIGVDCAAIKPARQWFRAAHLRLKKGDDITVEYAALPPRMVSGTYWELDGERIVKAHILLNANVPFWPSRLYVTLLHEMGHALGLMHSADSRDVMYPVLYGVSRLSENDKSRIRALYQLKYAPQAVSEE